MELVDGDAESPTLISNMEVMQLLKKNIDERSKQNRKKKNNKRNKLFRDRDWVEGEVHKYLESTPCVKLDPDKREEFYSKLKGSKKLRRSAESPNGSSSYAMDQGNQEQPQSSATGFNLTEAEALQIMNMMPSEPVEIHLMVDELQSRMSETRQEEFLSCISAYSTAEAATAKAEPMEEDDEVPRSIIAKSNGGKHENGKKPAAVAVKEENAEQETGFI